MAPDPLPPFPSGIVDSGKQVPDWNPEYDGDYDAEAMNVALDAAAAAEEAVLNAMDQPGARKIDATALVGTATDPALAGFANEVSMRPQVKELSSARDLSRKARPIVAESSAGAQRAPKYLQDRKQSASAAELALARPTGGDGSARVPPEAIEIIQDALEQARVRRADLDSKVVTLESTLHNLQSSTKPVPLAAVEAAQSKAFRRNDTNSTNCTNCTTGPDGAAQGPGLLWPSVLLLLALLAGW